MTSRRRWPPGSTRSPPDADAGDALAGAVTAWARLHGVIGLEAVGHVAGMGFTPATLLSAEIDALADAYGLP